MSMKFSHMVLENCRSEGKDNASRGHMVLIGMHAGTKKKKSQVAKGCFGQGSNLIRNKNNSESKTTL